MARRRRTDLLIIDPQIDFCDPNTGSLYVPGAENDMGRVAKLVDDYGGKLRKIYVTMDQHHTVDVAHPAMWRNDKLEHPAPFTLILSTDIKSGKWKPIFPELTDYFIEYTEFLEAGKRYVLIIWPPHCLIGSTGAAIYPVLEKALRRWEDKRGNNIIPVSKGSCPFTEHYSAIKAEKEHSDYPDTGLNVDLIEAFKDDEVEEILVGGEASSHCKLNTVLDIANGFGNDEYIKKLVWLLDGSSPVPQAPGTPDFPQIAKDFIEEMKGRGMRTAYTTDYVTSSKVLV